MDETGRHAVLISRRGEQALNEATREMTNFRADLKLDDPRLIDAGARSFPATLTVVMQTIYPNVIVQQQSNTLAMRQLVTRGPQAFDLNWTFFGYKGDTADLRQRRIRQANLMGPAGLVSVDDSEVIGLSQEGEAVYPETEFGPRDGRPVDGRHRPHDHRSRRARLLQALHPGDGLRSCWLKPRRACRPHGRRPPPSFISSSAFSIPNTHTRSTTSATTTGCLTRRRVGKAKRAHHWWPAWARRFGDLAHAERARARLCPPYSRYLLGG